MCCDGMRVTDSVARIKILFLKDSTEGVAEGQTTASTGSVENTGVSEDRAAEK